MRLGMGDGRMVWGERSSLEPHFKEDTGRWSNRWVCFGNWQRISTYACVLSFFDFL